MNKKHRRIRREEKTIEAMVEIYCRDKHGNGEPPCSICEELMAYAKARLAACPYQETKTACAKCPTHCYKPAMRDKVKGVMRYSGPKMTYLHPVLALFHALYGFKEPRKRS